MCQSNLNNEICNNSVSDATHLDATKWRNTLKFSHNFADDLWSTCISCISLKYFTVDFIMLQAQENMVQGHIYTTIN